MKQRRPPIPLPKRPVATGLKQSSAALQANADKFTAALAMHQQGQLDQAEAIYKEILQSQPQHFDALQLLATIAAQRMNSATAVELFEQALKINPDHASLLNNRGNALLDLKRHEEALESYDRALKIEPDYAEALNNRGNALLDLKRQEEALESYDRAVKIKPDYAEALNNRGNALRDLKCHEEALESYDRALKIKPDYAEALYNRGNALRDLKRHEEALESYNRALKIKPDYADVHLNRAIVWLLLGDFQRGWPEYEWRWKCAGLSLPQISKPRWSGEALNGRTILLRWEQGLGDTLQFVRYARLFQRQGARVIVSCQKPLARLLQRCEGIDELVAQGEPLPDFDFWTPLLSIPGVLRTDQESIPGECGYLTADPALVARWKTRLADFPGFRIAIARQGNPDYQADRQRSIPLKFFGQLAQVPGVRLINLRKGPGVEQFAEIAGSFEIIQFEDLDTTSGPFMDTAAIMRNVDLTVSCDTSVAHLAGALGVPIWLGQTFSPDWRWLLDRDDSPWYPSLRSFRQQSLGDWDEVFQRMARTVRERLSVELPQKSAAPPPVSSASTLPPRQDLRMDQPLPTPTRTDTPPADQRRRMLATGFNALTRARHGIMLFNQHDMYIGRSLDLYGEFSEDEIVLFERFVRPGDVVIEGGANIGTHTIPLARMVAADGAVFAFEPQRFVFQTLCANVALNSLTNVDCRQQALGAAPGEIVVPQLDPNVTNNFGGLGLGQFTRGERLPVVTIDSLSVSACRLIKLDVEGMEETVLRGAAETLRRHLPILYVENDREDRSASLIELIQSFGYRLYWHTPPLYSEANFFGNRENVFAKIVSVNMLAVHPSSGIEIDDLLPVAGPRSRWSDGNIRKGEDSMSKAATIAVEIFPGELIDKITILEIKSERISDGDKLLNVRTELVALVASRDRAIPPSPELAALTRELKQVNESLWHIEDAIRDCERQKNFGAPFVKLARSVYKSNDRRSALKRQINELLDSRLIEEKSYAPY